MHLAFITLFLGLISGRMPVELSVTGPLVPSDTARIATVELRLDGEPAGAIAGPAFKGEIDLGPGLLPHHIEARGLDDRGQEVDRAEQWVNLPQPPATVDAAAETQADGRITAVRLVYRSQTHEPPSTVIATLDGKPLPVASGRVALPPYAPDRPHLLSIEARFPGGLSARQDLAFGGGLAGEVATDLTAVLVRGRGEMPALSGLSGGFLARGRALTPVAVEEGAGEILVVRDDRVPATLVDLGVSTRPSGRFSLGSPLDSELLLDRKDRVRFVEASPGWFSGEGATTAIFGVSGEISGDQAGLYRCLTGVLPAKRNGAPHLADAVAVAGLQAVADHRRRAVLLVLSGDPKAAGDASHYDPRTVRRFLEALAVPLYVWSLRGAPLPPGLAAWGEVEDASSLSRLRLAHRRLTRDLARQRIVWLDGRHLPQSIALSPAALGSLELATAAAR